MSYLAIICGLYIKRNGKGRRLTISLIGYGTLILGRALYIPIVILLYKPILILLYGVFYTRALIDSTSVGNEASGRYVTPRH